MPTSDLAATLAAYADAPPNVAVRAVLVRGVSLDVPAYLLRRWLSARTDRPDVVALVASDYTWKRLYASARAYVRKRSTAAGRRDLAVGISRALIGRLLTPPPAHLTGETGTEGAVTPHQVAVARHVLAVLGALMIDNMLDRGMDAVQIGKPRLATVCGLSKQTLSAALDTCHRLEWLRALPSRGQRDALRYKLCDLSGDARRYAESNYDLVGALAHRDTGHPIVEIILAASHPAICHAPKEAKARKAWLYGLADQAGIDPTHLGLSTRTVRDVRPTWVAMSQTEGTLVEGLDALAETTGAFARAAEAEAVSRAQAAARIAAVEAAKARQRRVNEGVRALVADLPIPDPRDAAEVARWSRSLAATIAAHGLPEDLRPELGPVLRRMLGRGTKARPCYDTDTARDVAAAITGSVADMLAAA